MPDVNFKGRNVSGEDIRRKGGANIDVEEDVTLSYIPLPHEKPYYEELFLVASDYKPREMISANKAWSFLSLSGLPISHIELICSTSKSESSDKLTQSEFNVAIRLVQLRQNSCKVTDLNLNEVESHSSLKPAFFQGVSDVMVPLPQVMGKSKFRDDSTRRCHSTPWSLSTRKSSPSLSSAGIDSDSRVPPKREHSLPKTKFEEAKEEAASIEATAQFANDTVHRRKSSERIDGQPQRERMHSKERHKEESMQEEAIALQCCQTCAERSDQTANLVLKVLEMEKQLDATKGIIQELKAEIESLRREAAVRNDLQLDQEREILKERHKQIEKMKSKRKSTNRELTREKSGRHKGIGDRQSSRRNCNHDLQYDEVTDKLFRARERERRTDRHRSRSTPEERSKDDSRSRSKPVAHVRDGRSSDAQCVPGQIQLHSEQLPGSVKKPKRLERSNSLRSFSDLLGDDDEESSDMEKKAGEGKKPTVIKTRSSWFGKFKMGKDKEGQKDKVEEQERLPDVILTSDQSGGFTDSDAPW